MLDDAKCYGEQYGSHQSFQRKDWAWVGRERNQGQLQSAALGYLKDGVAVGCDGEDEGVGLKEEQELCRGR